MRIAIVGPGAIGSLFYIRLSLAGHQPWLIARDERQARALSQTPLTLLEGESSLQVKAKILCPPLESYPFDLVLIATKAQDTKRAAETALPALGPSTLVLTLQNGLGPQKILLDAFGEGRVLAGTTAQGATLLAPGVVRHGGDGETYLGPAAKGGPSGEEIARILSLAGLKASATPEIFTYIWRKLAINCAINPLTAILGVQNGELAKNNAAKKIIAKVAGEVAAVALKEGVDLGEEGQLAEKIILVAEATAQNRSSMLQDVAAGRLTETDFINGAVAALGKKHSIPCPLNETLHEMIKALEAIKRS